MSAVPIIINGVMVPKGKSADDKPVPAVFIGYASVQGLTVGGGPVVPDGTPPVDPPIDPPPTDPPPNVVVVIKAAPVTGGWGLATDNSGQFQWFYAPAQSGAGPR